MTAYASLPVGRFAVHELRLPAGEELIVTIGRAAASSYSSVELVALDGAAAIYFRTEGAAAVAGSDCDVFPAVVGTIQIPLPGYGAGEVDLHLISTGTPLISLVRR